LRNFKIYILILSSFYQLALKTLVKTIPKTILKTSIPFSTHQYDMKRKINILSFHIHDMFINSNKFDININNDELLKTIWEHKKRKKKKIDNQW